MVGPSTTDEERTSLRRRLLGAFVLLIAASGGLVAIQNGATVTQAGIAAAGGLAIGLLLGWFLLSLGREIRR